MTQNKLNKPNKLLSLIFYIAIYGSSIRNKICLLFIIATISYFVLKLYY